MLSRRGASEGGDVVGPSSTPTITASPSSQIVNNAIPKPTITTTACTPTVTALLALLSCCVAFRALLAEPTVVSLLCVFVRVCIACRYVLLILLA